MDVFSSRIWIGSEATAAAQADFRVGINLINLTVLESMVKECNGLAVDNSKDRTLQ
jgi:hypothetical protein